MATAINNDTPKRFEAGGKFILIDGATEYELLQMEPGSVSLEPGGYEPLNYTDRGVQQFPLEGDERLSMIKATLKLSEFDSSTLIALGNGRDTSTGKMKAFGVRIEWYDHKGAATGDSAAYANTKCYFTKPPVIKTGDKFDTVEIELASISPLPTLTSI